MLNDLRDTIGSFSNSNSNSNNNSNSLNSDPSLSPTPNIDHLYNRFAKDNNNPCLGFNVFHDESLSTNSNDTDYKLRPNGIKYALPFDRNTAKRKRCSNNRSKPSFIIKNHYKKRDKNECVQYEISVKEIGNNLKRIFEEQILTNKASKSKMNHAKDILMIEGPLNDYTKFKRSKPVNLKMIRNTRNTTNTHQSYKRVKTAKDCEIGDEVILINNLQRDHYKVKNLPTDILQVHGVVNQIHPHYITIIVPVNHNQHFIQRKIYSFSLRDDNYGAVYIVNKSNHS